MLRLAPKQEPKIPSMHAQAPEGHWGHLIVIVKFRVTLMSMT
jgi:hypothetical protein